MTVTLDGDLTPSQRQAVTTPAATVCVLASAGAGKTRVLTRRVGYRVASGTATAEHTLAITFTRKAAGELHHRLAGLGLAAPVTGGTFHSLARGQLRRWWADRGTPEPALLTRKGRLLAELVAGRPGLADVSIADLAGQLEWAKARLVAPGSFAVAATQANRELPADAEAIGALFARYEDEKRKRRLVDFDDLLVRYADALETDGRFAAAQRWRWQHVFVDELQDVNPLQCRLLLALLGDNEDLFVVGDPNQAIYGWNGADPGFLADFPRRWPMPKWSGSTTTTVPAPRWWRPRPPSSVARPAPPPSVPAGLTVLCPTCARSRPRTPRRRASPLRCARPVRRGWPGRAWPCWPGQMLS